MKSVKQMKPKPMSRLTGLEFPIAGRKVGCADMPEQTHIA